MRRKSLHGSESVDAQVESVLVVVSQEIRQRARPRDRGANAAIGVRYDATEIMRGVTEVLCYGTAVIAEAKADHA